MFDTDRILDKWVYNFLSLLSIVCAQVARCYTGAINVLCMTAFIKLSWQYFNKVLLSDSYSTNKRNESFPEQLQTVHVLVLVFFDLP